MSVPRGVAFASFACVAAIAVAACGGSCGRAGDSHGEPAGQCAERQAAASQPSPISVAVLGSATKLRPRDTLEGPPQAVLVAARNEFESFQLAIAAKNGWLHDVDVKLNGPLVGPDGAIIPEGKLTVYRVGYYDVKTPSDLEGAVGPWPDALIPTVDPIAREKRSAFPIDVPAGENRLVWIDVQVPDDATPGVYQGAVTVTAAAGACANVPVKLTVLEFTLPSTTTLKSAFGLRDVTCDGLGLKGCSDPEVRARSRALFILAALDNRMTIAYAHLSPIYAGRNEGLAEFRTHFLPFLRGTAPTRLPGAKLSNFQVNQHRDRDIAGWKEEVQVDGFADRAFVWSCDEPHFFPVYGDPEGNWKLCREKLEEDNATWPEAPKMVTTHLQSSEHNETTKLFDILTLNVELVDGRPGTPWFEGDQRPLYDQFLGDSSRNKELWLYTACGSHGCTRNDDPYSNGWAGYDIDAPASETRAMAWLAFRYRATGTLYFETVINLSRAWDDQYNFTGNGDGNLFYPGTPDRIGGHTPIPVESMRMKFVRDGYEDYEYLKFLDDHGRGADAQRIAKALFPAPYATARTDAEVQAARRELATLVAEVTGGPRP